MARVKKFGHVEIYMSVDGSGQPKMNDVQVVSPLECFLRATKVL